MTYTETNQVIAEALDAAGSSHLAWDWDQGCPQGGEIECGVMRSHHGGVSRIERG